MSAFNVQRLVPYASIPSRATDGSAGYDISASEPNVLTRGDMPKPIKIGLAMKIPDGYVGKLCERSGLALKGIKVHGGVIDSDFSQEVKVIMTYHGIDEGFFVINRGDRIAQLVLEKITTPPVTVVDQLEKTARGGFGSTGIKPLPLPATAGTPTSRRKEMLDAVASRIRKPTRLVKRK